MYILLNGAFGIGKTRVAKQLVARLSDATIVDPEHIGLLLQRLPGNRQTDFQHLPLWRRLTIAWCRMVGRFHGTVVIPMAFSDPAYLDDVRRGLSAAGRPVLHLCLTAPLAVVRERLAMRGEPLSDPRRAWVHRRAAECCEAHVAAAFAVQVPTEDRSPDDIVAALIRLVQQPVPRAP